MNSGMKTGMRARVLSRMLPVSRSAPLAFCALVILSNSSMRVGMNRSAMVIIMAIVWTPLRMNFSGDSSRSMASVMSVGDVV